MVTVRVKAQTPGHGAELQVEDSGPGVAPAEREQVFRPFHRTLGTATEGTGLGLAIVQKIVSRMGGSLELSNASSGGLCVNIRLQRADVS